MTPRVLLVEDNLADIRLTQEAFRECSSSVVVDVAENGEKAIDLLEASKDGEPKRRPSLILLDLNMPGRSGFEVLELIKEDPELRAIPVIVMTSSEAPQDLEKVYQKGANCYLSKPIGFAELLEFVEQIDRFWFQTARLPSPATPPASDLDEP